MIVGESGNRDDLDFRANVFCILNSSLRLPLLLPAKVRKRSVGLCHTVNILLLLDRISFVLAGKNNFFR